MPTITKIEDLRVYFEALANETSQINSFIYGDIERVINALKSEMDYPCLFLETPDKSLKGGIQTGGKRVYDIAFEVVEMAEKDDWMNQNTLMGDKLEGIIEQLIIRVAQDFKLPNKLNEFKLMPIMGALHDNVFGWRVEVQIDCDSALCPSETFWT